MTTNRHSEIVAFSVALAVASNDPSEAVRKNCNANLVASIMKMKTFFKWICTVQGEFL